MKPDFGMTVPPARDLGRVHFIGIGGAGMSGIARILLSRGMEVSGSDAKNSRGLTALRALGGQVFVGHAAEQVGQADTVVVSTAVRETNPELAEARRRGLRILHRSQALAALMADRRTVAVAGTHGKTTTTGMVTVALQHCAADPSFAIGGELTESGANAHDGSGDVFVAEADESDSSFLLYRPLVAVVTNVEPDHLDHYGTAEAVEQAFDDFCDRVVPGGTIVACLDDPGARRVASRAAARRAPDGVRVVGYGWSDDGPDGTAGDPDGQAAGSAQRPEILVSPDGPGGEAGRAYLLRAPGTEPVPLTLRVPGRHNALNAAASWGAACALGFPPDLVAEGLGAFGGTRRRFEARGEAGGVRVFDDYAHHPTEVVAVLRAARDVVGGGRLVVVFQPHLFSRTRIFARDFAAALGLADEVVVMDVYAAREDPEPGVTGGLIASAIPLPTDQVTFVRSWSAVAAEAARRARRGDLVLTVGAGDVTMLGPEILSLLAAGSEQPPPEAGG